METKNTIIQSGRIWFSVDPWREGKVFPATVKNFIAIQCEVNVKNGRPTDHRKADSFTFGKRTGGTKQ